MAIYLGDAGWVEIRRDGERDALTGTISPDDVNEDKRRFSFDFDSAALISGDRISIRNTGGGQLVLVQGHNYPDGTWYCHVDPAGGIRLYTTYAGALNGDLYNALPLERGTTSQQVEIHVADLEYRCVAQLRSWELTTDRERVDTTSLGEEHRRFYASGLISGQGTLQCLWDYRSTPCSETAPTDDGSYREMAAYFSRLVLRVQQGASFDGRFYLAAPNNNGTSEDYLWFDAKCLVSSVGMTFNPTQVVESRIDYVTTGPIHLRMGKPPGLLLQENRRLLLQEDGKGILLENEYA